MLNDSAMVIRSELGANERLLWSGQPSKGIVFRTFDLFMIPFSLLWGGFALVWETAAIAGGAPFFFMLWGIPFVLLGLYLIVGRFLVDAWRRSKTYYGVTNERIIIVSGLLSRTVKSLNLRTLTDLTMDQKADGRGTITFGPSNPFSWWGSAMWWPGMGQYGAPAFESIPDVKQVYDLIRRTQRES